MISERLSAAPHPFNGAGNWDVTGSSSGAMGSVTAAGGCQDVGSQFQIDIAESSPVQGDRLDFALLAASQDQNVQKQLLFGPGASGFNNGGGMTPPTRKVTLLE